MGIDTMLRHRHQSFLPRLTFILGDFFRITPGRRVGTPQNSVFGDHPAVFQDEIPPYQSPAHTSQHTGLQTGGGFERNDFPFFGRPACFSTDPLRGEIHAAMFWREASFLISFSGTRWAPDDPGPVSRRPWPRIA